jgi:hypothetical protein
MEAAGTENGSRLQKNDLAGTEFSIYFELQSAFMTEQQETLDTLKDIRNIMDRSSRFLSLSGWSGVAAGCCALVGAWMAHQVLDKAAAGRIAAYEATDPVAGYDDLMGAGTTASLVQIGLLTLVAAIVSAFLFTWWRSRKQSAPLWNATSQRLTVALGIPMLVGGIYLLKLVETGSFGMVAPGCLLFYGLGLINASRYTLGEIKWLGYAQLATGLVNLAFVGYGLYFWAFGFGLLHIIYGLIMWWKHERNQA